MQHTSMGHVTAGFWLLALMHCKLVDHAVVFCSLSHKSHLAFGNAAGDAGINAQQAGGPCSCTSVSRQTG